MWLFKALFKALILATAFYLIKVDNVNTRAILDFTTKQIIAKIITKTGHNNSNMLVNRFK